MPCKPKFHFIKDFLENPQSEMFKFFLSHNHLYFAPKPRNTSNIWLKQAFLKAIMYIKTSEQHLEEFGLLFALFLISNEVFQVHLSVNKNQRKRSLYYINLMYQVSIFYSEKSLSNKNVHLRILKSNVTNSILKLPWKKFQ